MGLQLNELETVTYVADFSFSVYNFWPDLRGNLCVRRVNLYIKHHNSLFLIK